MNVGGKLYLIDTLAVDDAARSLPPSGTTGRPHGHRVAPWG